MPADSHHWLGWVAFGLQHEGACKPKSIGGSVQEQNPGCTSKSRAVEQFGAFPSCGGASHDAAVEGSLQLVCSFDWDETGPVCFRFNSHGCDMTRSLRCCIEYRELRQDCILFDVNMSTYYI